MATTNMSKGKAITSKNFFSRETSITIHINAKPATIWNILTDISDFARWNSTIVQIKGEIAKGKSIRLKSNLDLERKFVLKVKEFEPNKRMVWVEGTPFFKGARTFLIEEKKEGGCNFTMVHKVEGIMAPIMMSYVPDFDESFEDYTADLKKEAELVEKANTLLSSLKK